MTDQEKIKIPIIVYSQKTQNPNSPISLLLEYVLKNDSKFEIIFIEENSKNYIQKMNETGIGVLLFDVTEKEHVVSVVTILTHLQTFIKKRSLKAIGFCSIKNSKLTSLLLKKGTTELLNSGIAQKSLIYKFDKIIQIIENQIKTTNVATAHDPKKNQAHSQAKKSNYVTAKIEWIASDQFASDFWIIQKKGDIKRLLGKWFMEVVGPPPVFGKWESLDKSPQNQTWKYCPRQEREPFYQHEGEWIFKGNIPEFSWETYTWRFTGNQCRLEFHAEKDCVSKKAGLENDVFKIMQNPPHFKTTLEAIKKLMVMELQLELKKKKEGTPDYKHLEEKIKQAQGFEFKVSKEVQPGGPLGVFEQEENPSGPAYEGQKDTSENKPWGNSLQNSKDEAQKNIDKIFEKIQIDITIVFPDLPLSTTATLLDMSEDYLAIMANVPENIQNLSAHIQVTITAEKKKIEFSVDAEVEEALLLDEFLNHSIDLKLKNANPENLEILRSLLFDRQGLSTYFFHSAKGI